LARLFGEALAERVVSLVLPAGCGDDPAKDDV